MDFMVRAVKGWVRKRCDSRETGVSAGCVVDLSKVGSPLLGYGMI